MITRIHFDASLSLLHLLPLLHHHHGIARGLLPSTQRVLKRPHRLADFRHPFSANIVDSTAALFSLEVALLSARATTS